MISGLTGQKDLASRSQAYLTFFVMGHTETGVPQALAARTSEVARWPVGGEKRFVCVCVFIYMYVSFF
jgi:hypothetical protein